MEVYIYKCSFSGCEILPENRNYLRNDKYTLTRNECKQLGYCWDKETVPDGINCYMKQCEFYTLLSNKPHKNCKHTFP